MYQPGVDSHSSLRLFEEIPAYKCAAGHPLVAEAAAFMVMMDLVVFVEFIFLPSGSSGTKSPLD